MEKNTNHSEREIVKFEVICIDDSTFRLVGKDSAGNTIESESYILEPITPEELQYQRAQRIADFTLKVNGELFSATLSKEGSKCTFFGQTQVYLCGCQDHELQTRVHLCGRQDHECMHLSAKRPEEGGCLKVRYFSRGIERFPFIILGFETYNTQHDVFVVFICANYEESLPRRRNTNFNRNMNFTENTNSTEGTDTEDTDTEDTDTENSSEREKKLKEIQALAALLSPNSADSDDLYGSYDLTDE